MGNQIPPKSPQPTRRFRKDIELAKKRGRKLAKLEGIIGLLVKGQDLPARNRDHALSGDWAGFRECHIEPDWLLVYAVSEDVLVLERTGTHSDLFD